MLQVTALPFMVSFLVVVLFPDHWKLIIFSRLVAGLGQGLITSNVYGVDMANKEHRQALYMITVRTSSIIIYDVPEGIGLNKYYL